MNRIYQSVAFRHRTPMVPARAGTRRATDVRHHGPMDVKAVDWAFVRQRTRWLVPAGFIGLSLAVVWKYVLTPSWLGLDASLYAAASAAWLEGADPWAVSQAGIYFAAPPPTLLAFVAFAWMPPAAVSLLWISGSFALAVLAVRRLRLPLWWVAFPRSWMRRSSATPMSPSWRAWSWLAAGSARSLHS
jgi:hypothetical protein